MAALEGSLIPESQGKYVVVDVFPPQFSIHASQLTKEAFAVVQNIQALSKL
jgi:hypothetical protein